MTGALVVDQTGHAHPPGVLIIVQNLPVPLDRRVWLESQALAESGFDVSVVCPGAKGDPKYQVLEGIKLYKYRPYPPTQRKVGLIAEDAYSVLMTSWLVLKASRRHRLKAIQTCNPRDVFWPIGLAFKALRKGTFVFDQHDLCPELFESRFPNGARWLYWTVRLLEACTYRTADHVISTNDSYRRVAMDRGRKQADQVTVVRSGPDDARLRRGKADGNLKRGRSFLVCYLGVMGPQDGVDIVLQAASILVHDLGRKDVGFMVMGGGDCLGELIELRDRLGLQEYVELPGRVPDDVLFAALSTADLGLCPDPKNPLNDVSTMNKTMEYMAFELPIVAFDLHETRVSAGEAAVYVADNDATGYAKAIVELLDDAPRRQRMGRAGRARVESELAWRHQRERYVGVYDRLLRTRTVTGRPR